MQIFYLARLVLVQLESKFKLCRFLYTKNADEVCMFCFQILYLWLLYSIVSATFVLFFFDPRTDSSKNDIFFLNLTKIECIVGELFKNRVKFMSVNSFVGGSYLSLGTFLNRFPLHIIKRENIVFPYFTSFSREFPKGRSESKRRKST